MKTSVALLTGGMDKHYALSLAYALASHDVTVDLVGAEDMDCSEIRENGRVHFFPVLKQPRARPSTAHKVWRIVVYYIGLLRYAFGAQPQIFHILWNRVEFFDRTALCILYRLLRKRIVLTVHNVNAGQRDATDGIFNRLTLKLQYRMASHMFVHTDKMKAALLNEFGIRDDRITVIPYAVYGIVPNTSLTSIEARRQLGFASIDKMLLFFGNIAPYKGLDYLVDAFVELSSVDDRYRLIIAGRPKKGSEEYWTNIETKVRPLVNEGRVLQRVAFIPDEEIEVYFKAADVLLLPYRHIFQSGVLFMAYGFGLPVIAADVGSLRDYVFEGETGFVHKARDAHDLAGAIRMFYRSDLYANLESARPSIRQFATARYSWDTVARLTRQAYDRP